MINSSLDTFLISLFLLLLGAVSTETEAQIYFDIDDKGENGIEIIASGSAVVPAKSSQFYNIGVLDFDCVFVDESFQDFCQNGHQTTIDGGAWSFASEDTGGWGIGPGILFNGFPLNNFFSNTTQFGLNYINAGNVVVIPDTDGSTPITASGILSFPDVDFSLLPGAPGFGQTTVISLFNEGNIIFRLNGGGATCNGFAASGQEIDSDTSIEVCNQVTLGPDFTVVPGATVTVSAGSIADFVGKFEIKEGATLSVTTCGQDYCGTSNIPMRDGCSPCITEICLVDPWCCNNSWDVACRYQVRTVCNLRCQ